MIVMTGGATGIGAATIERLRPGGQPIHNLDIATSDAPGVTNHYCNLADPASIDDAIAALPQPIDVLIHVAGVGQATVAAEVVMAVNFLGLRHLTERLVPNVQDSGRIVIVASSAGRDWQTRPGPVNALLDTPDFESGMAWLTQNPASWRDEPYKFSKQCAAAYTYRAAGLARNRRVTVNCVNPGIVSTALSPQFRDMLGGDRYDWILGQSGRAGEPDDIAEIISFLAVGDCGWLNGVEITVDGGYHAGQLGGWINLDDMP